MARSFFCELKKKIDFLCACLGAYGCAECFPNGTITPSKRKIDFDDDDDAVIVEAAEMVERVETDAKEADGDAEEIALVNDSPAGAAPTL